MRVPLLALATLLGCGSSHPGDPGSDAAAPPDSTDAPTFTPAPHVAWPLLPDHGGHKLTPLRVVTVIAADEPYAAQLTAFGDALVHSAWLARFATEYGLAATGTHQVVTGPHVAAGTSFTQLQMNTYIRNAVMAATPAPTVDGHTVYVLYLPPGTVMNLNGTPDTTCAGVPYHLGYGTLGDGMAVLNRCPTGFYSQLEMFEVVAAHEVAEAATDSNPLSNPAWELYVDTGVPAPQANLWNQEEIANGVENGDLCIGTRFTEAGHEYQRIFSNAAGQAGGDPCVPALPVPFFNVSPDATGSGWIQATPGAQLDIPVTGWSTGVTDDWIAEAEPMDLNGAVFPAHLVSATTRVISGTTYKTTNNGRPMTVHATIPATATSGWWGVVKIWSGHYDASGNTPVDEDISHEGLVGVYLP